MRRHRTLPPGGAIDFLEEAVHLLRRAPVNGLVAYCAGAVPFVVVFLYYWADMIRSAFAYERHASAALVVALCFLWMKAWQAVFTRLLWESVSLEKPERWSPGRFCRALSIQAILQSSALFVLPVAFAITLPFGWSFAFYQNAAVFSGAPRASLRSVCKQAASQAGLWPGQNHVLLGILGLFGLVVFLNVGIALFQLPQLLKTFLGTETRFSQSGWAMLNSTFFIITLALTWLGLDPLLKAVYVLRCFHGQSVRTGEDLRVSLRRLQGSATATGTLLVSLLFLPTAALAATDDRPPPHLAPTLEAPRDERERSVPAPELDRTIQDVISQREYSWRLPRQAAERAAKPGLVAAFVDSILETLQSWAKSAFRTMRRVVDWILDYLARRASHQSTPVGSGSGWSSSLQFLLFLLLAALASVLAVVLLRLYRQPKSLARPVQAQPLAPAPDLADQNVVASQLPATEWLRLAEELADRGELRLALRALYLAGLAHLGGRELLRIAKFKSNRDYQRELARRVAGEPELLTAFASLSSIFDQVWYGLGEVNPALLAHFRQHLAQVTAC